jgi:hypothetical protein
MNSPSTYLDFSIQTRADVYDWVLKKLGYPLVQVEITEDQLSISLNDAVEEFTEWVVQEDAYLALNLSGYNSTSGFILPGNVVSVFAINENKAGATGGINTLFSVQNQLYNEGLFPPFVAGGGWVTYELSMQYIELIERLMSTRFSFEYNQRTKQLGLIPDPTKLNIQGYIVLGCKVIRSPDQQYGENWVKRMTLALAKQIIGNVRSKFDSVGLLGGGSINKVIREEGIAEAEALRVELKEKYTFRNFFVG